MKLNYSAERLIKIYNHRWALLGQWRNRYNEIAYYIMPAQRSGMTARLSPGTDVSSRIYDSTALEANDRLSNRLHEALTNPATAWFHLRFKDDEINKNDAAREWLDDCELRIREAVTDSNFDMVMGQFYLDIGAFGTASFAAEERPKEYEDDPEDQFRGFLFRSIHLGSVGLAESVKGVIDQVYHKFDMTAEQWIVQFGEQAPQKARDLMGEDPDKILPALVCRYPRHLETRPNGPLLPQERPFAEVWICFDTKEIVAEDGTYEQAVFVGRWRKKSDDIMGYGPGERALPTVRTVNEAERLELAAWAKVIDPPIKTTANNIVGDANFTSKGITVVRDLNNSEVWDMKPDLNHHMIQLEDKRFQIRDIFKYHSLELPPREAVGEMTAFEVAKRVEQIYRSLGPTVVQLQADVLNGLVNRLFGIMYRKKAFLPPPAELIGKKVSVDYVGPMALAAKATELDSIDRFAGDALALKSSGVEEAMDIVDLDNLQRYKADLLGVPAIVLRSEQQIKALRKVRNDAKIAAAEQQSNLQATEGLKNIGQGIGQEHVANALQRMGPRGVA